MYQRVAMRRGARRQPHVRVASLRRVWLRRAGPAHTRTAGRDAPLRRGLLMLALLLLASARADDAFDATVHALSIKDPPPACEQIEALSPDPVALLLRVVDEIEHPPWVAMRAADCLVTRHAPAIEAQMTSWMGDRQRKGLGFLALGHLDEMEPALATRIAS